MKADYQLIQEEVLCFHSLMQHRHILMFFEVISSSLAGPL